MSHPTDLTLSVTAAVTELQVFEHKLLDRIADCGLPTSSVLADVPARAAVFQNVDYVLARLTSEQRFRALYIAKFMAAAAAGLFDAALNYMWDETVNELRRRIAQYDVSYFFDIAVTNPDKRRSLNDETDLCKIDDSDLIRGANAIGMISDLGYKHLDYIRYMRNWASAAHPNHSQITGLQLIAWLETCITEVINLPEPHLVVEIKKLLSNIRVNALSGSDATQVASFFVELDQERVDNLASGFFGIFTRKDSAEQSRQNIRLLAPKLWLRVSEQTRKVFGVRYAQFVANNDSDQATLAREFLDVVGGAQYVPEPLRAAEIENAIDALLASHRGMNNFYTEPGCARQLSSVIGATGEVPKVVAQRYVQCLVEVFLSNGNGVARNAEPYYRLLLSRLKPEHAVFALLAFTETAIASQLQFPLCQGKWKEMIEIVRMTFSSPAVLELVSAIERFPASPDKLYLDSTIRSRVTALKSMLGI